MAERSRLLRKMRRKQAQFRAAEPETSVKFLDDLPPPLGGEHSVYHFFVGNGGTRSGLGSDVITALLECPDSLYMPESRDYSFASVSSREKAERMLQLNGLCVQDSCRDGNMEHFLSPVLLQGPLLHLYISPVESVPEIILRCDATSKPSSLPPGLILVPDFVTPSEEAKLFAHFTSLHRETLTEPKVDTNYPSSVDTAPEIPSDEAGGQPACIKDSPAGGEITQSKSLHLPSSTLKHRTVSHYGYEFLYGSNNVNPDCPLPRGIPDLCAPVLKRMMSQSLIQQLPDQLTVNDYLPGAGIIILK